MAHTIETVNDCTKKIIFNYEDVDLSSQVNQSLVEKQKTSNLKGFRKGKAPLEMIRRIYGEQIESDALYRFVSEEFFKVIREEDIKAIGYPTFSNTKREENNVSFEATVEIFPEITIKDYSKYEFKKDSAEVTEEDFNNLVNQYLGSKSQITEITDESVTLDKGHYSVINFEGEKEDGEKPDNMKAEEFMLEVGSGQFIPGFEDQMIGMKKGEKRDLNVTFPEEYHEESLRGAKVKFAVELLEIKEKKLPELNEELAKEFGFESVEDFNSKNRTRLEKQKEREVQTKLQQEILDKLIEDNTFTVPDTLLEQQKKGVRDELAQNLMSQGFTEDMVKTYFEKWEEDVTQRAMFQVRSGLILDQLAVQNKVEATEEDLDKKIDEMALDSGMERTQIESYYKSNENIKNNLMYAIREEKTFEKIISDMKIS